ncbi:MAG: OmpA family protein, partial [Myxococcales bacterium]|nr:OmpA family protein [Myxococcales bacterium]
MTLLHGITVLDLIDELPPGSRGFVPADIAGFFELLAIVDHATLTSGAHYIHHGVLQSAQDAGLSLPRGFPLELPGLNTGVRFQFSSTRAQPSGGQNLEPEPSGWQLDLFLDRLAVPIPGLKPAVLIEAAPSQPAHLAAAGGSDVVKLYGKGVLRISSGASGVDVRLIADPDPFTPDAPIGAVLKLGLSPPHALFGDGSTGFGMTLGEVTVDASEEFTPTEIIARGHGPEWQGFGINEAAIYLPRNLPGVGDVSLGVKDLLIGTSDPGGVQLEAWLQLGQSATAAGNLQFLQDVRGHVHDMGGPAGADNQRSLTVHGETGETARVRVRVNAPATNAQWKRPGEEVWSTGVDTGWFAVRVGGGDGNVLHYRDVTTVGEGSDARQVAGEELLFEFIRGAPTPPVHPPQIRVERGALGWDNVAHLGGSAAELGAPTFRAMATVPALTDAQKAALTWELTQAGATVTGHGESFTPSVTWQVGEHDLVLRDGDNRRRRLKIQVLERGLLIVGARAGVFEVEGGVSSAATPTSVVARHTLRRFHAEGLLDSRGASASIAGATVTVSDGALADLTLERGGGGEPDTPTPPATPPVAHVRVLMDYDTTNALGWHEIHAQQTGDGTLDPWGPAPFYSAHANLEHTGDARRSDIAGLSAWVASIQAIDPNIKFVVIGHCCDLGSQSYNERLGQDRAKAGRQLLINSGAAEAQVLARGELRTDVMPSGPLPADPSGFAGGGDSSRTLTERTAVRWRIKHHISDSTRSGWGNSRTVPERERSRGVDIYALVPAANAGDGEPSVDDAQSSTRRRSLVPGGDSAITPAVSPAESNLNYRFELRAKWDSPTWVDERDSIPVLVQLTFDWTPTDLPLPDTGGGDSQAIRPVNPQTGGTPDNYRIVARFTFDPRSGQAIFSASLDSPGDENGLAKFTSSTDDAAGIAGKTFAAALALGPALLADVSTASPESAGVRIGALLAAVVAATALDIVQEGSVVLHRVEIEHLQRDLGSLAGSRTRLLCDYVVELKCSAAMFGVVSEDPIKLRYKNVGLELDDSKQGIEKFNLVFEEADFEVANPGKWRINGWLGQLLGITAIRLGTGSVWFELDMELALDLGVVEISRATIRITIKDGGVTVDLRGLAASVDIPGTVKGAGALQVGGDGDVSASLDLTIIPADIRAYAAFVMRDGMTHLEAGLRFATAIPLGGTGFGIYGFMGRFVSNGTRNLAGLSSTDPVQREMQWYALPPVGPTSKYIKRDGQYAIGLGVVVGTMPDAGFTFNAEGMLTFEFPDPSVVLTIDASLMNPPSGAASEQGSGGAGYSLQLLGVISVSAAGLAIGIAGKFTVPEVVEATIPFAAWFPFQSGGPAGYLRVGSDGHMGRAGEPVSVKILPKIFDLKAWAFFMVEEKELLQLGKHPDFNFHGFSIGFGTGFSLKWGGDVVYLEVSASILAGFGTRPFTLMAGIFLKGELWLVIIGLSVSAELILRIAEDSWDLRGKVCGKISFFFFTIEGCVDFQIGEEPSPPPPPLEPLITGVQLADKRARVLADAVDEATTTTLTDANTAWPDATIVIHFAHTVQVAL